MAYDIQLKVKGLEKYVSPSRNLSHEHCEKYDDSYVPSVKEQVERFLKAGELYELNRQKEYDAMKEASDSVFPEDVETILDTSETPDLFDYDQARILAEQQYLAKLSELENLRKNHSEKVQEDKKDVKEEQEKK